MTLLDTTRTISLDQDVTHALHGFCAEECLVRSIVLWCILGRCRVTAIEMVAI